MGVYASYRQHNQAKDFAELTDRARRRGHTDHETEALNALTRMVIVTGKTLRNLDLDDLVDYVAAAKPAAGRSPASRSPTNSCETSTASRPRRPPGSRPTRADS